MKTCYVTISDTKSDVIFEKNRMVRYDNDHVLMNLVMNMKVNAAIKYGSHTEFIEVDVRKVDE
jgi:hypothetical protein